MFANTEAALAGSTEISSATRELRRSEVTRLAAKRQELTAVKSYLRIGEYYQKNRKPLKALEIYIFGLNHQPDSFKLLGRLLRIAVQLKKHNLALPYAEHYVTIAPDSREAFHYYSLINDELSNAARARTLKAEKEFSSVPPAKVETSTENESTLKTATPEKTGSPAKTNYTLEEKLKALRVVCAIDAAVKTFNLHNKEKPMETLSLDTLTETGILPKGLRLRKWKDKLHITNGELAIKGLGTVAELKSKLKPFREQMQKVRQFVQTGEHYEALNLIDELTQQYPAMREIAYKRLFILISAKESVQSVKVATELRNRFKDSPRPLFELVMVYYKLGNYIEAEATADSLIQNFPKTHWAGLALKIKDLMVRNVSFDLLANIKEARREHLKTTPKCAKEEKTKTANQE